MEHLKQIGDQSLEETALILTNLNLKEFSEFITYFSFYIEKQHKSDSESGKKDLADLLEKYIKKLDFSKEYLNLIIYNCASDAQSTNEKSTGEIFQLANSIAHLDYDSVYTIMSSLPEEFSLKSKAGYSKGDVKLGQCLKDCSAIIEDSNKILKSIADLCKPKNEKENKKPFYSNILNLF